ncbi:MAG: DUF1049 domain-containing protein [Planctomycetaceae bacterium]|nr:DUF1049 domain-containing protein [Planctomycetaceae bacterium]
MRSLIAFFLLVFFAVITLLCFQNDQEVTLTVLAWHLVTPVWLVAVTGYILGMLTGWGVAGSLARSWRRVTEPENR